MHALKFIHTTSHHTLISAFYTMQCLNIYIRESHALWSITFLPFNQMISQSQILHNPYRVHMSRSPILIPQSFVSGIFAQQPFKTQADIQRVTRPCRKSDMLIWYDIQGGSRCSISLSEFPMHTINQKNTDYSPHCKGEPLRTFYFTDSLASIAVRPFLLSSIKWQQHSALQFNVMEVPTWRFHF